MDRIKKFRLPSKAEHGLVASWVVNIIVLLFCTTSLVQAFVIPTGSMENTLLIGDHLLVDKLAYAPAGAVSKHLLPYSEVKRGDIIVLRDPVDLQTTLVKRAIGLPGDRIHLRNKQVYLNGKALDEPYVVHNSNYIEAYRDNFPGEPTGQVLPEGVTMLQQNVIGGELVVPPGHYFALGDNRDNSLDSRYWGLVPRENIIGTPLIIFWSYDAPTEALLNPSIGMDHVLDVSMHFFTKTRWSRTFHLIRGYNLN